MGWSTPLTVVSREQYQNAVQQSSGGRRVRRLRPSSNTHDTRYSGTVVSAVFSPETKSSPDNESTAFRRIRRRAILRANASNSVTFKFNIPRRMDKHNEHGRGTSSRTKTSTVWTRFSSIARRKPKNVLLLLLLVLLLLVVVHIIFSTLRISH